MYENYTQINRKGHTEIISQDLYQHQYLLRVYKSIHGASNVYDVDNKKYNFKVKS